MLPEVNEDAGAGRPRALLPVALHQLEVRPGAAAVYTPYVDAHLLLVVTYYSNYSISHTLAERERRA
jgi:hypothetical protein